MNRHRGTFRGMVDDVYVSLADASNHIDDRAELEEVKPKELVDLEAKIEEALQACQRLSAWLREKDEEQ